MQQYAQAHMLLKNSERRTYYYGFDALEASWEKDGEIVAMYMHRTREFYVKVDQGWHPFTGRKKLRLCRLGVPVGEQWLWCFGL